MQRVFELGLYDPAVAKEILERLQPRDREYIQFWFDMADDKLRMTFNAPAPPRKPRVPKKK